LKGALIQPGTMPARVSIAQMLGELLGLLAEGAIDIDIDIERVPLSHVAEVWNAPQAGRRPVFIP